MPLAQKGAAKSSIRKILWWFFYAVLADQGYDADYVADAAIAMGAKVLIPSKANPTKPRTIDKEPYKARNLIERLFNKLKNFRRVATRYDKTASAYMAFVTIAGMCIWLN